MTEATMDKVKQKMIKERNNYNISERANLPNT